MSIANLGTNRLSGHAECRFCLSSPSVVMQGSILHWNSRGEWRYICMLAGQHRCQAEVIWEMSVKIPSR